MIITPYSGLTIANTAANFPALKHCFECNDETGFDSIYDHVAGVRLGTTNPDPTGIRNSDGTLTMPSAELINTLRAGAWVAPGTKKVVVLMLAKGAGSITFGSNVATLTSAKRGIRCALGGTSQAADATTLATTTATVSGAGLTGVALTLDWGIATGFTAVDYDGTTYTARAATTLATVTTLAGIDANGFVSAALSPAFYAVLHFTTLPSAAFIKSAIGWMRDYTNATGKKQLFPGLAGLAS